MYSSASTAAVSPNPPCATRSATVRGSSSGCPAAFFSPRTPVCGERFRPVAGAAPSEGSPPEAAARAVRPRQAKPCGAAPVRACRPEQLAAAAGSRTAACPSRRCAGSGARTRACAAAAAAARSGVRRAAIKAASIVEPQRLTASRLRHAAASPPKAGRACAQRRQQEARSSEACAAADARASAAPKQSARARCTARRAWATRGLRGTARRGGERERERKALQSAHENEGVTTLCAVASCVPARHHRRTPHALHRAQRAAHAHASSQ